MSDMEELEKKARLLQSEGNICSYSLNKAFLSKYNISEEFPKPRSVDGKCGALLTTEKILKELNKDTYINEYEEYFLKEFGSLKCVDILKLGKRCNDCVGLSARYIENVLNKKS